MKKIISILIVFLFLAGKIYSIDAPVTTSGNIIQITGTTAVVPVYVTGFTYINSFALEIHYDPTVAIAVSVSTGSGVGGGYNTNLTTPGVIIIGWYIYPAITLVPGSTLLNITFSKVADGMTVISWFDDGYSCYYADGDYVTLNDVPQSSFYINGSLTFGAVLTADFSADNTTPSKNATVHLTDLSSGGVTSWDWSFSRTTVVFVNGTNIHSQNPDVQFTEGGSYTVTLVAHKGAVISTKVKTDYIRAGISGLWSGIISRVWNNPQNWDNWLVPDNSTSISVIAGSPNWPLISGNLTAGTDCSSLTLSGSAFITVNGDFTISNGANVVIEADGTIEITGNWSNSGNFNHGTGTVDFIGNTQSQILSPSGTDSFYNLKVSKNGASLINNGELTVNGNMLLN